MCIVYIPSCVIEQKLRSCRMRDSMGGIRDIRDSMGGIRGIRDSMGGIRDKE